LIKSNSIVEFPHGEHQGAIMAAKFAVVALWAAAKAGFSTAFAEFENALELADPDRAHDRAPDRS
jgi:hypothetical protein